MLSTIISKLVESSIISLDEAKSIDPEHAWYLYKKEFYTAEDWEAEEFN